MALGAVSSWVHLLFSSLVHLSWGLPQAHLQLKKGLSSWARISVCSNSCEVWLPTVVPNPGRMATP